MDEPPEPVSRVESTHAVIRITGLVKTFNPRAIWGGTLKQSLIGLLAGASTEPPVEALRGIDFEVRRGESVGIMGANGSGKSTLLKLISGITPPTRGAIQVQGRVLGMIELGAGFHDDLSGEENVRLQGAVYGLSRREVERRIDAIFDYAQLHDFRLTALKHYSSGMVVRLGFSIAIQCDPDILLVDEVLSVGDQSFQNRCLQTIADLHRGGTTILFVTHHMDFAEQVCDRLIWLKNGRIHRAGPAAEIVQAYHNDAIAEQYGQSEGPLTEQRILVNEAGRFGTGEARIEEVRMVDAGGRVRRNFRCGEPFAIEIDYSCDPEVEAIDCSITIDDENSNNVAFWRAEPEGGLQRPTGGGGRFRLFFPRPPFQPGHYGFSPAISPPGGLGEHYDLHLWLHHFSITPGDEALEMAAPLRLRPHLAWRNGAEGKKRP